MKLAFFGWSGGCMNLFCFKHWVWNCLIYSSLFIQKSDFFQYLTYHISPNKHAGCGGTKRALILVSLQWNWRCEPSNTSTLSADNLNQIGLVVSEIWPDKVVYSGRRVYLAKYGIHSNWYVFIVTFGSFFWLDFKYCPRSRKFPSEFWISCSYKCHFVEFRSIFPSIALKNNRSPGLHFRPWDHPCSW